MEMMNHDINQMMRSNLVPGQVIAKRMQAEIKSVQNLFRHGEQNWVSTYYYMREKFLVLDKLEDSFAFNWDANDTRLDLNSAMELPSVIFAAEARVQARIAAYRQQQMAAQQSLSAGGGSDTDSSWDTGGNSGNDFGDNTSTDGSDFSDFGGFTPPVNAPQGPTIEGPSEDMIEWWRQEATLEIALAVLDKTTSEYAEFKYIIGVYAGSKYHLETLQRIDRYYRSAAEQGNPIAQFHYALFLKFLGDIVYPDARDLYLKTEKLLDDAEKSEVTKKRVAEARILLAEYNNLELKSGEEAREKKKDTLKRMELEKIERLEDVLIRMSQNIGNNQGGMGGRGFNRNQGFNNNRNQGFNNNRNQGFNNNNNRNRQGNRW
jgi:hypothetical protein